MHKTLLKIVLLFALIGFSTQTFAGAGTTSIIVDGPGLPPQGISIPCNWPGWLSFIDRQKGQPAPNPASDLPRYVLTGYTNDYRVWYTVLYVWDHRSNRALVYLPGQNELGYRINNSLLAPGELSYEQLAGKWYYALDQGLLQGWADSIRKVLPQAKPISK